MGFVEEASALFEKLKKETEMEETVSWGELWRRMKKDLLHGNLKKTTFKVTSSRVDLVLSHTPWSWDFGFGWGFPNRDQEDYDLSVYMGPVTVGLCYKT